MVDAHRGGIFLHALSPSTRGFVHIDPDIIVWDVDLHFVNLSQYRDGGCRGMNASLRLCDRHPLDPVDAGFVLQA